ncbi:MAG: hypothetical protein M3173_01480, partial [Chloroflexota bacterium]|nr:hypothetical protein [Chloroflexota bacterium]
FNYYVLDVLDGQHNLGRYRDHLWGRIYGPELREDLQELAGGSPIMGYHGEYTSSLDRYRNRWTVNVVFISNVPLDKGELGYQFLIAIEMESRRLPLVGGKRKRYWRWRGDRRGGQ